MSEDTDEIMVFSTSFASVFINNVSGSCVLRHRVKEKRNYQLWMRTGSGLNSY